MGEGLDRRKSRRARTRARWSGGWIWRKSRPRTGPAEASGGSLPNEPGRRGWTPDRERDLCAPDGQRRGGEEPTANGGGAPVGNGGDEGRPTANGEVGGGPRASEEPRWVVADIGDPGTAKSDQRKAFRADATNEVVVTIEAPREGSLAAVGPSAADPSTRFPTPPPTS